jgi:hypothetical protein
MGFLVLHLLIGSFKVRPTWAGKLCTLGQIVMVAGVLVAPDVNRLGGEIGTHSAFLLGWGVVGLCVLAVASYTRLGLSLLSKHETPHEGPPAIGEE